METRSKIPVGPPLTNPLPSYWHEPKSPLANTIEQEPAAPTKTYDYAIIGSGISGTMIAYNLLKTHPDAQIIMLEARDACGGATGRNGGHTKAATYRTYLKHRKELGREEALKVARLEYENIKSSHGLAKELGIECESQECMTVDLIYDKETFEEGKQAIEILRGDSSQEEKEEGCMAWYKTYEPSEAGHTFFAATSSSNPEVQDDESLAGAFEYAAGRINAYKFSTGVLKSCVQRGLRLCTHTPVHAILPSTDTRSPSPSKQGEQTTYSISTQYNIILAKHVILATNGYTPYLLPALQSKIVPLRGQITAQVPPRSSTLPTPLPTTFSFIYKSGYEYMIPRPLPSKPEQQHIIIGGGLARLPLSGAQEYGTIDDSALNPQVSSYLAHTLPSFFGRENWGSSPSSSSDSHIYQEWTGIMGATTDGLPFVGEVPGFSGLWVSAGFNGHGMVLCLKSAEALVSKILGGEWPAWFPRGFEITGSRVEGLGGFAGRRDLGEGEAVVPETGGASVEGGSGCV